MVRRSKNFKGSDGSTAATAGDGETRVVYPELLSDAELVERVLFGGGGGSCESGHRLLGSSGGIGGLGGFVRLRLHDGTGGAEPELTGPQILRLAAALELGRRAWREPAVGLRMRSQRDVLRWASGRLTGLEYEEVWVLALRANQRVLAEWCVARGGVHGCGVLPADVLRPVLRCAASGFILVHNHPSGDPTPSRDDVVMTEALQQASLAVGVTLVDHVVVSRGGAFSMAEARLFDGGRRQAAAE